MPGEAGSTANMELSVMLSLPRDAVSVAVVRRVAAQSLRTVGFVEDDVGDAELAISEASSNVLRHSQDGDEYEVRMRLTDATLVVEVLDTGTDFDGSVRGHAPAGEAQHDDIADLAESGRGIQLMRSMVDDVRFSHVPGQGNVVQMSKVMRYREGSVVAHLLGWPQAISTSAQAG